MLGKGLDDRPMGALELGERRPALGRGARRRMDEGASVSRSRPPASVGSRSASVRLSVERALRSWSIVNSSRLATARARRPASPRGALAGILRRLIDRRRGAAAGQAERDNEGTCECEKLHDPVPSFDTTTTREADSSVDSGDRAGMRPGLPVG